MDTSKKLSGYEARMKAIQDALNENASERVLSPSVLPNASSAASGSQLRTVSGQKRDQPESDATQPPAKRRQYPESWSKPSPDVSSKTEFKRSKPTAITISKKTAIGKPAAVFLSQEQTHILKLVQEKQNVFYTGSAGMLRMYAYRACSNGYMQVRASPYSYGRSSRRWARSMRKLPRLLRSLRPQVMPHP